MILELFIQYKNIYYISLHLILFEIYKRIKSF